MKSTESQLANRGFLIEGSEKEYLDLPFERLINLLQSKKPFKRTLGARLLALSRNEEAIDYLI